MKSDDHGHPDPNTEPPTPSDGEHAPFCDLRHYGGSCINRTPTDRIGVKTVRGPRVKESKLGKGPPKAKAADGWGGGGELRMHTKRWERVGDKRQLGSEEEEAFLLSW